ncbi:MAG: ribosome-recycling factor [bacterium]|nr:ribosome-recycling factor [bacterium]
MDYKEIIKKIEPEMEKAVVFFNEETKKIRTGKAMPSLIENIRVDYMGTKLAIKQLAAITIGGARELLVQPWDKESAMAIENSFKDNEFGLRATISNDLIRVIFPEVTEENRQNLIKIVHQKAEETRKKIRHFREQSWTDIQKKERDGEIREDDKFRAKDKLQELIDKFNEKVDEIVEKKEKEISI